MSIFAAVSTAKTFVKSDDRKERLDIRDGDEYGENILAIRPRQTHR